MVAGFDRYYQIATCLRDEDLRADRQFEHAARRRDGLPGARGRLGRDRGRASAHRSRRWTRTAARPFRRMTWQEAHDRYGSDKPDLRFGLEIEDATGLTRGSNFGRLREAPSVRFLRVPQELSRSELDRLETFAKEWGAQGLAYLVFDEEGEVRSPIAKFLSEEELAPSAAIRLDGALRRRRPGMVARVLGALRLHLGRELGLIDESRDEFLWVTDFPLFEWVEDEQRWNSEHPRSPGCARATRISSRRIRASRQPVLRPGLERLGARLGLDPDPPPGRAGARLPRPRDRGGGGAAAVRLPARGDAHGGAAPWRVRVRRRPLPGTARRRADIREVVAFPKAASGSEPMTGAPTSLPEAQLRELGIRIVEGNA